MKWVEKCVSTWVSPKKTLSANRIQLFVRGGLCRFKIVRKVSKSVGMWEESLKRVDLLHTVCNPNNPIHSKRPTEILSVESRQWIGSKSLSRLSQSIYLNEDFKRERLNKLDKNWFAGLKSSSKQFDELYELFPFEYLISTNSYDDKLPTKFSQHRTMGLKPEQH